MGQSIAGICTNTGFEQDGFDLGQALELRWKYDKKISSETAFKKNKNRDFYDVCFLENATLILTNLETGIWGRTSEHMEVFSFAVQESTMSFSFKWCQNADFAQRSFEVDAGVVDAELSIGAPLPLEQLHTDYTHLIEAQIKQTTGYSLNDFTDKEFHRFKWVDSEELLKDLDYALRSNYFFKYIDTVHLSNYSVEDQIRLFELLHQHAVDHNIDVYHYMTDGDADGNMPLETVFKSNYHDVIKILLENQETESVILKHYTKKQSAFLFGIDPCEASFYEEVRLDHLKTEAQSVPHTAQSEAQKNTKNWWEFWWEFWNK